MEPAIMLLILSGIGLILLLAWTMYRVQHHRQKMRALDEKAIEIGRMAKEQSPSEKKTAEAPPTLPENKLLIVMYRNKKRPWRSVVRSRIDKGEKVLVVSSRPPREMRKLYPDIERLIWLNRSTAHDIKQDTTIVNPTNLSSLLEEIRSYLGRSRKGGTLVFEGFEDIISGNENQRVMRFLNMLKTMCSDHSISAVVPLPYRAVPQRVRNQLSEGFESVVIG